MLSGGYREGMMVVRREGGRGWLSVLRPWLQRNLRRRTLVLHSLRQLLEVTIRM